MRRPVLVLCVALSVLGMLRAAHSQESRAEARLKARCAAGKEDPARCPPDVVAGGGGGGASAPGGGGAGSGAGASAGQSYERRTVTQRVPGNTWEWRHCGTGVGLWKGSSGDINRGSGEGEIKQDGTGTFVFRWTNLGDVDVEITETGTLRLDARGSAADEQTLTVATTAVRGFWNPPKPLPRIPAESTGPPSPQGTLPVAVERLPDPCDPRKL